ncbi:MAG: co-chaperone GroES family protein [Flavobacteriales bacterium]|jgi:co-chaperonin GroES (HSP10)|tara:strand:- start:153 stop:410 length:258 start_codon:yes stop_codon:yes gene_type:complete
MKAIGTNVVVRKTVEEVKSKTGLILSEVNEKDIRYKLAEVVSAGEDVKDLSSGDSVYYDSAAGSDIRINGEKLTVVNERNIVVRL